MTDRVKTNNTENTIVKCRDNECVKYLMHLFAEAYCIIR